MEYRYITGVLPEEKAREILQNGLPGKKGREQKMLEYRYLAYSGSCSWLGYSDQQLKQSRMKLTHKGAKVTRKIFLKNWEIEEAIEWVTEPAEFKPSCIKQPTFPDEDMHIQMEHATVPKLGGLVFYFSNTTVTPVIDLNRHNRVIFKHLLQAKALSYLQIDSCRLESVNESLSVLLMYEFGGLCQLIQHLIMFDIQVREMLENRYSCPG
ncbi:mitochondrial enolase superfamily member 1 [Prinia subflava]|uniref:mitochondrial enolase superfamily member 1 n=1 Tax=Prinia subflava TaxID=208062 RepID=UPI002FE1F11A